MATTKEIEKKEDNLQRRPVDPFYLMKQSETLRMVVANMLTSPEVPLPENYEDYAQEYEKAIWVFACIRAISSGLASLPWIIEKREKITGSGYHWAPVYDHPAVSVLEFPNEMQTWKDLIEGLGIYLEISGDGFIEIARAAGRAKELYLMRPDRVSVVPAKDGSGIEGYVFQVKKYAKKKNLPKEDVLYLSYFNPLNDWQGLAPEVPATDSIILDEYTRRYNKSFFKNNATPAGFLHTDQPLSEEMAQKLQTMWAQQFQGMDQAHKTAVLTSGLQYTALGTSPKDMDFPGQRRMVREEVLAAFGVPPVMVGLLEHAKYNNYRLQVFAFYRGTIRPKARKIEGVMSRFINDNFKGKNNDKFRFRFDFEEYLGEEIATKIEWMWRAFGMAALTPNQIIETLSIGEPYEGGDQHYLAPGVMPADMMSSPENIERREIAFDRAVRTIMDRLSNKYPERETDHEGEEGDYLEEEVNEE